MTAEATSDDMYSGMRSLPLEQNAFRLNCRPETGYRTSFGMTRVRVDIPVRLAVISYLWKNLNLDFEEEKLPHGSSSLCWQIEMRFGKHSSDCNPHRTKPRLSVDCRSEERYRSRSKCLSLQRPGEASCGCVSSIRHTRVLDPYSSVPRLNHAAAARPKCSSGS